MLQSGALTRAEVTVFAEEVRHHGIGRVFKSHGALDEFSASVEKLFGMRNPNCPTVTLALACARNLWPPGVDEDS